MSIVYRCETPDGIGIYFGGQDNWEPAIEAHRKGTVQHPSWKEDGHEDFLPSRMVFGFNSIDQMKAWFIGIERLFLSTFDVQLSCYLVSGEIYLGRNQVLFEKKESTLIWQRPLSHF